MNSFISTCKFLTRKSRQKEIYLQRQCQRQEKSANSHCDLNKYSTLNFVSLLLSVSFMLHFATKEAPEICIKIRKEKKEKHFVCVCLERKYGKRTDSSMQNDQNAKEIEREVERTFVRNRWWNLVAISLLWFVWSNGTIWHFLTTKTSRTVTMCGNPNFFLSSIKFREKIENRHILFFVIVCCGKCGIYVYFI